MEPESSRIDANSSCHLQIEADRPNIWSDLCQAAWHAAMALVSLHFLGHLCRSQRLSQWQCCTVAGSSAPYPAEAARRSATGKPGAQRPGWSAYSLHIWTCTWPHRPRIWISYDRTNTLKKAGMRMPQVQPKALWPSELQSYLPARTKCLVMHRGDLCSWIHEYWWGISGV